MRSKYINPFTDYGFKRLFGEEANKHLLIAFLNDILPIEYKISKLEFKKNEVQGDTAISRKAVYDIFCEDEKGNQFIVEMQNAKQTYFKDRAVFYSTFPIRDQAQKGDWNFKLQAVYCIALLGFNFEKSSEILEIDEIVDNQNYYHKVQLKDQRNNVFYEKLNFVFIELPKFIKEEKELETHFDKWLYFLKHLDSFKSIPEILNEDIFIEAFKSAEIANFTDEEYKVYEDSLMIMRDNINVINTAKEEGREEGRIEGREEGKIEGREEGKIEGKKEERKEIAIEMLKDKEPIDKIIKYSKLNEEEILKLKKIIRFHI